MILRWLVAFFLGFALMGTYLSIKQAISSSIYPPVAYLASELGVTKGAQLQKGVIYNGHPFFFTIIGAQEHPNGRYTVELQAR